MLNAGQKFCRMLAGAFRNTFDLAVPRQCYFCGSLLFSVIRVCHAFLSVYCSLEFFCWERAGLLALLYVMCSCVLVTYPCGVLGRVWYLVISILHLCLLTNFIKLPFVIKIFLSGRLRQVLLYVNEYDQETKCHNQ